MIGIRIRIRICSLAPSFAVLAAIASTVIGTAGCGAADTPAGDPPETTATASAADGSIDRTIVTLKPDGTATVQHVFVTQAQSDAEKAARSGNAAKGAFTADIAVDYSCAPTDLWLFSGANATGAELCLKGSGQLSLATVCQDYIFPPGYCYQDWTWSVGSYWPGNENGYITTYPCKTLNGVYNCPGGPYTYFSWSQFPINTDVKSHDAWWVTLTN
jgi:hypothetical protein